MKIGAVSYQTKPNYHFTGENSKKNNSLKNTAGAAALALAAAMPIEDADAQIYFPPPIYPPVTYTMPSTPVTIPKCFIYGDTKYSTTDKTLRDAFSEIDSNGNENGVISAREVIRTERNNWNRENYSPFTTAQMRAVEEQFNTISEIYNEDNSDPSTMNFREYKAVMKDYSEEKTNKKIDEFINILTLPYIYSPFYTPICPPPHHHHHRPAPPPRHHHNH